VARAAGIELRYVPYGSGQLATLAGLNGEVDIAGGGVHEHIQFVDTGQLISLQQAGATDITTSSGKVMPSLSASIPGVHAQLPPSGGYNIGVRRDTPLEIIRQIETAFLEAVKSDVFRAVLEQRNFVIDVIVGAEADRRAAELEVLSASLFAELNIPGARTAAQLGLPGPDNFDHWWPPEDYEPL